MIFHRDTFWNRMSIPGMLHGSVDAAGSRLQPACDEEVATDPKPGTNAMICWLDCPSHPSLPARTDDSQKRLRSGFTLIELLVTLAVIAVLAAFLFPAFQKAGTKARAVRCAHSMRQIGLGMQLYADADPNGHLPGPWEVGQPPVGLNPNPSWIYSLQPVLGNVDGLRLCPADPLLVQRRTNASSSYVLNQYTSSEARRPTPSPSSTSPSDFNASLTDPGGQPLFHVPHIR